MTENSSLLFLLPLIAALIGWATNYLAIKMLFHPREPKKILGLSIQGVFPKRQNQIAEKLGTLVANELFSMKDIGQRIEELSTQPEAMEEVGKRIEKTIRGKLISAFPMLSMFLSDDMIEKVTNLFKGELEDFMKASASGLALKMEESIDVEALVREKVSTFSSDKVEELLIGFMEQEFRFIEKIGAVLGFFIGCVQVALVLAI
ncbi:MAG: DUF445 family protein [Opitutales bacterium]|jgi:uncharacterized membrane protein YheB (UPF0754 family)|uniref:DUF445 domain-containing protein n=1 Tax=Candidatus Chordibacter forsetii TaxID=3381758 RepID=UPI00231F7AE9|nr:DUF445 family protein [Opitutales bacterium]MDA8807018.1 DUF445 family protein [Opitutales bacterium]MDA8989190.1 DUF445 family protein [Opitutales bacterium]MDA9119199.1 DUF445 family protein [Opitutales bacterium]MDG1354898.1 DUF445 family protein [Opitutales bacterium]